MSTVAQQAEPSVIVGQVGAVQTISLNRPESYNALNKAVKVELHTALKQAARDQSIRCVVLTGIGKAFCSGQDLKEAPVLSPDSVAKTLRELYNPIAHQLYTMEKPILAAINGVAAGAGLSIALACDLRIMADSASLRLAFSSIGLIPDCAATYTLAQIAGRAVALELAFTGRAVDAAEALALRLVNRVVPATDLLQTAGDLARMLAERPTRALGLSKRAINRATEGDLEDALEYEAMTQAIAAGSVDFAEGVNAFREKRIPGFVGH